MSAEPWRLFGLECHECGRPAEWFDNGVTLPCGCGLAEGETRDSPLCRIEAAPTTKGSPKTSIVAQAIHADRAAQLPDPEAEAWREIVECLVGLQQYARREVKA